MRNSFLKQMTVMVMALILAVTMMPWNVMARTTVADQVPDANEQIQNDEEFEAQKEKVIGVLMMMVSFFAEEEQASIRSEIQERIAEMDGMTSIGEVGKKAYEILTDLIANHQMKATTLDEWKAVVTDKVLPVLDPDYFKESDQENLKKLREDLEKAVADAETEEDISSIQTALINGLVSLMQCDVPSQNQILAIAAVKGAYLAAIQENEGGSIMVPGRFLGKLEESYKQAIADIQGAETDEEIDEYVAAFNALIEQMAAAGSDEEFEAQKEKVIGVLMMMVPFFAEKEQASVRTEIQNRIAEMDGMTSIGEVGRKAYGILTDLIDTYPMKATILDEWKAVVTDKILPVLDPDYFKESDQENLKKLREELEKAAADAKTEDDVSSIKTALIKALVGLVQFDLPSQNQIKAIAAVKGAYQAAIQEKEDGSTVVPSRFFGKLEEAYKEAIAGIQGAETDAEIGGYVDGFSTLIGQMAAAGSAEEFEAQKEKVIGVLMMMASFFAEDSQAAVRAEIQKRIAETDGMVSIIDVAKKANKILNDLMAKYPMKATTLKEWKAVVTDKILPVLDPEYFKESDQERVEQIREELEKVVADAKTEDDISSIQSALITALHGLMRCDMYDQYQILAISEVKGLYSGAIEKGDDGNSLVPEYLWDDLKESYDRTIKSIKIADSEEKAEACVSDFGEVIKRMRSLGKETDLESEKRKALRILRSIVNLYPSEDSATINAIINEYREKILDAKTADEVWEIMLDVNSALLNSGVSPRFDNLDQWKNWARRIVTATSPEEYVVEDRAMVGHIIEDGQKAVNDAKDAKEVQIVLFGFARHLEAARDLEGYRNEIIKEIDDTADRVCKSMDYIDLGSLGDKAAVRVAAEKVIRQVSNSVSAKEMKSMASNLSGIGVEAIKAWIVQSIQEIVPEDYIKEDREELNNLISDIREKVRTVESMTDMVAIIMVYQSLMDNDYTLLADAVNEAAITITDHANKAQANLTGDARSELIQSELNAITKLAKLESKKELDAEIQAFDKKAGEIKAAAEKAAGNKAAEKAAADKAAAQKNAETKFVVKSKKLKASSKKKKTFSVKKAFDIKNAPSSLTFKKTNKAGKGKIVVKKTGKVIVKKGLKKGTYKVKVRVTSKATATLKEITRNIVLKVKVK